MYKIKNQNPYIRRDISRLIAEKKWCHTYDYSPGDGWNAYTDLINHLGKQNPETIKFFEEVLSQERGYTLWYAISAISENKLSPLKEKLIGLLERGVDEVTKEHISRAIGLLEKETKHY